MVCYAVWPCVYMLCCVAMFLYAMHVPGADPGCTGAGKDMVGECDREKAVFQKSQNNRTTFLEKLTMHCSCCLFH